MRSSISITAVLFVCIVFPALASDFAGPSVLIPIAGRTPGAFGSQWRTDLVVTNAARTGNPVPATIVFSRNDGARQIVNVELEPRASVVLKDVIQQTFGQASAMDMIRVGSPSATAKLSARARIYNVGSAVGEYGQIVQGIPTAKLTREAYLSGLSGVGGTRTNVGLANPGTTEVGVFLSLFEEDGSFRGGFSTVIPAGSVRQYNDIFSEFQAGPLDGATLQVTSTHGVYAYATMIRSDSGDADFITATGVQIDESEAVVMPQCANPAPLHLAPLPAGGWIVMFVPGTDPVARTAQLATELGFTPSYVYEAAFSGFTANLTQATIAALRCAPAVERIEQNALVPLP